MAVFDTVRCFCKLPVSRARQWVFQTHDTPDPAMWQYIIRADGQLWRDAGERRWEAGHDGALVARLAIVAPRWVRVEFSGTMELSAPMGEDLWLTLVAVFDKGWLQAIDLPEENRLTLSPQDWEWLDARLGSTGERTNQFQAASEHWRVLSQGRRDEPRAQSLRIAVMADRLLAPCVEAGWGGLDDLRPMLEAAASSVVAGWDQCDSDHDRASLLEKELVAWFGRESVDQLPDAAQLAARVSDALQGEHPAAAGSSQDGSPQNRHWNYRVFRCQEQANDEPLLELREVHYEGDRVVAWTQKATEPMAESVEALRGILQRMLEATRKQVMDEMTMGGTLLSIKEGPDKLLTRDVSRDALLTLQERMAREPEVVLALLAEAQALLRDGDVKTASLLLRDMGRNIGQELLDSLRAIKSGPVGRISLPPGYALYRCVDLSLLGDLSGEDLEVGGLYLGQVDQEGWIRVVDVSGEHYLYPC